MLCSLRLVCLTFLFCLLGACSSVSYYGQAVSGHLNIVFDREPINDLLQNSDSSISDQARSQLRALLDARKFAVRQLALPDNGSYTTFVDLGRPYPVWNVVATDEFSTQAKQWCYLVIGCASYRGYYDKANALAYAKELEQQGLDVHSYGVTAYSTLGWFSDPVLSSMLANGELYAIETMFHELAHQQLYFGGQSEFNEAFATAVAQAGIERYLKSLNKLDELQAYRFRIKILNDFETLLFELKQDLDALYRQDIAESQMRVEKAQRFQQFKQAYGALFLTYREQVSQFLELLNGCGADFGKFYHRLEKLKAQLDDTKELTVPADCEF